MTDHLPPGQPQAPDHIEGQYAEEVTSHSYKELENLAMWAKHKGPIFYLIGGWAPGATTAASGAGTST